MGTQWLQVSMGQSLRQDRQPCHSQSLLHPLAARFWSKPAGNACQHYFVTSTGDQLTHLIVCNKTKNQSYYSQQEKNKLGKQAPGSLKSVEHTGSAQLVGGDFCKIGSHLLPLPLLGILVTEQSHHISMPVSLSCRQFCWSQLSKVLGWTTGLTSTGSSSSTNFKAGFF